MKFHVEQAQRSKNFRTQSEITERAVRKGTQFLHRAENRRVRKWVLFKKETLEVFYIRVPRETERHQRKK